MALEVSISQEQSELLSSLLIDPQKKECLQKKFDFINNAEDHRDLQEKSIKLLKQMRRERIIKLIDKDLLFHIFGRKFFEPDGFAIERLFGKHAEIHSVPDGEVVSFMTDKGIELFGYNVLGATRTVNSMIKDVIKNQIRSSSNEFFTKMKTDLQKHPYFNQQVTKGE